MPYEPAHQQMGKSVGAKLREARLAKKYTQSQLAQKDFSVSYISAIERGQIHPSLRALEIFALRLGLSSKDLLTPQSPTGNNGSATSKEVSSEDEIEWQILAAQVAMWQGIKEQAILQLRNLLAYSLTPQQEILVRYTLAQAYEQNDQLQESELILSKAMRLAKDGNDPMHIQLLNLQGILHHSLHDYAQGITYHQQCLEKLESQHSRDAFLIGEVYTYLGRHYMHLERVEEAQEMFAAALKLTEELTQSERLAVYWNSFQQYIESSEYLQASLHGYRCLHLLSGSDDQARRRELRHALGRAMIQSNQQETRAYLEKTLEEVQGLPDQLMQASAHVHMAGWLLAQNEVAEAKKHAQKAHKLLSTAGDSSIAADASIISGKIEYAQKRYKAGDAHFEAGLEMLERLNSREDLADHSAHYAQLLEDRNDVHRAVLYWKKAFDSLQRMKR
jgi:tetratricopeptide (TPR) repeat protein/DNA-binding XRE family transcriptional regulator